MVYLHYTGQRKFYATGYIAIRNFFGKSGCVLLPGNAMLMRYML